MPVQLKDPRSTSIHKLSGNKDQALLFNGEPNAEGLVGIVYDDPRMGFKGVHLETSIWLDGAIRNSVPIKVQPPDLNRGAA